MHLEQTNLLPENYEEAMSLAYGGARAGVGKVFDLGNNVYAGANITAQTGGILKGDTTLQKAGNVLDKARNEKEVIESGKIIDKINKKAKTWEVRNRSS